VKLFAVMRQEGLEANAYVYNAIIDAHIRTERYAAVSITVGEMSVQNCTHYSNMLACSWIVIVAVVQLHHVFCSVCEYV
jgi:hypothetical protein